MDGFALVGREVVTTCEISEEPDECGPGGVWAGKGARLVVYRFNPEYSHFRYGVHPPDRPEVKFGVDRHEITPAQDA